MINWEIFSIPMILVYGRIYTIDFLSKINCFNESNRGNILKTYWQVHEEYTILTYPLK